MAPGHCICVVLPLVSADGELLLQAVLVLGVPDSVSALRVAVDHLKLGTHWGDDPEVGVGFGAMVVAASTPLALAVGDGEADLLFARTLVNAGRD